MSSTHEDVCGRFALAACTEKKLRTLTSTTLLFLYDKFDQPTLAIKQPRSDNVMPVIKRIAPGVLVYRPSYWRRRRNGAAAAIQWTIDRGKAAGKFTVLTVSSAENPIADNDTLDPAVSSARRHFLYVCTALRSGDYPAGVSAPAMSGFIDAMNHVRGLMAYLPPGDTPLGEKAAHWIDVFGMLADKLEAVGGNHIDPETKAIFLGVYALEGGGTN